MAEELRLLYSDEYIKHIALNLSQLSSEISLNISEEKFSEMVLSNGWGDLPLKQRMTRLTETLHDFLPNSYPESIEILKKLLPKSVGVQKYDDMLTMFIPEYVFSYGMDTENWDISLDALEYFTSNGTSSEFAIRPFIIADRKRVMEQMLRMASSADKNIRRFSSEGCRPRLPWAEALPELKKDPSEIFLILDLLKKDESKFVQKSVANNLNDISKDNPEMVLEFARRNIGDNKITDWILKHGCRTMLKKSDKDFLELFGVKDINIENAKIKLVNSQIKFGSSVEFEFSAEIANYNAKSSEVLRIEYGIDFMKSNGKTSRKIFKISESALSSQKIELAKKHKFINYTTRKHYEGEHNLAIIINGREVAAKSFKLYF